MGKNADLVLLDRNPIRDAGHLGRIWAVVLNGKVFAKDALEKMKSDLAAVYAGQLPNADLNTAVDQNHKH